MITKMLAGYPRDKNLALSIAFEVDYLLTCESAWSLPKKLLPVLFFLASCSERIHRHYLSWFGSSYVFEATLEY